MCYLSDCQCIRPNGSDMRIAVTGHRPNKLGNEYDGVGPISEMIKGHLQIIIDEHKHLKPTLITGMALGVDMLWAELAIANKLKFIAAIPCQQQYAVWPQRSKERWMRITDHPLCEKYYVSVGPYTPAKMQIRNEWMVNNCDLLVAVWDGTDGGTFNCMEYARALGRKMEVFRINKPRIP